MLAAIVAQHTARSAESFPTSGEPHGVTSSRLDDDVLIRTGVSRRSMTPLLTRHLARNGHEPFSEIAIKPAENR